MSGVGGFNKGLINQGIMYGAQLITKFEGGWVVLEVFIGRRGGLGFFLEAERCWALCRGVSVGLLLKGYGFLLWAERRCGFL